ncbi:three component ABC system middle component [Pectobacterium sp. 1950-15]|uniref:three component ABC system middle component n=1 Tax=Pectobacterium sp. 1950-15 TaxID=3128982 RepID=UPI003019FDFE
MKIYNNELLGIFSMQEVLSRTQEMALCNIMLVLPIVFHKKSLDYLSHKRTNIISFQDLLLTKPELLVSINKRFYNFLPSSINCVSLCIENGVAEFVEDNLVFKKKLITDDAISLIGKRSVKIQAASINIANLILDEPHNIYDICGVRL